ncbi:MAG: hypothetical protein J6T43_02205 [Prevotella sp.]|nr:hypothetical protein [Prevotella sp.]
MSVGAMELISCLTSSSLIPGGVNPPPSVSYPRLLAMNVRIAAIVVEPHVSE